MSSFTARKVRMSDFEMIRMLGKGCAGKVLLVRHKGSSRLYALKAITKRHVLAHQELQHTLTEQAVLRRMAAEGIDPFVVKLWWSFHDKENLFLVMVRLPCIHAAMFPSVTCCHVLS
jgi:serine/threonine protein kinase